MRKILKSNNGFTFIEIISVLVILGILAAVVVSSSGNMNTEVYSGADTLKTHLRYAQTLAMNANPNAGVNVWGIKYDSASNSYWLFQGIVDSNYRLLPDDQKYINSDRKIMLDLKGIRVNSDFTVIFDNRGIPYSAYTTETTNTPFAADLGRNVRPLNATTPTIPIRITQLTGYIP